MTSSPANASPGTAPLAITMGDAAGIGPEIIVKLLSAPDLSERPIVIGDLHVLREAAQRLAAPIAIEQISAPGDASAQAKVISVLQPGADLGPVALGEVQAACGQAAFDYIRSGIDLALSGAIAGIVTAPIHKEALSAAGLRYPGHTEILADLGGAERVAMMLANDVLRVVLVTIHCSLRDAIAQIDREAVLAAIRHADEGGRAFGFERPRVAVAGLNPHAGEGGLFGREEIEIIAPAIAAARAEGIDASGPWPGDTVFMQARQGRFDVVVAQYHDQGLIPVKYLGLEEGVNITLGLPFIRTSPDHGTAFDIAGSGIADPASLRAALVQARRLAVARAEQSGANTAEAAR
ncbi:MAG: 4-hydroxythreonine-4-phosphate dehydrogenase PdxA [Neomegalonema sp.]|nr:4-hydroxythreonine-4-phosphate dehydrogenase PdxA [Neomegalonema sp.]